MSANLLTLMGLLVLFIAVMFALASYLTNHTELRLPALVLMMVGIGLRLAARRR